jgi:hypothetical protein
MRNLPVLLALLSLPLWSMAAPLVGFATISMKSMSPSQPNACAKLPTDEERDMCVEFTYTRIYKVRDFVDVKGHKVRIGTMVMTGHSRMEGSWFLVLDEMSPQDQKTYGARYRFVDGGAIFSAACIRRDANDYITMGNNYKFPEFMKDDHGYCYGVRQLRSWMDVH